MKITRTRLKEILAEEITLYENFRGTAGGLQSPSGLTPEDIANELLQQGVSDEDAITQAILDAGVQDDSIPDFEDAVWGELDKAQNLPESLEAAAGLMSQAGVYTKHPKVQQRLMRVVQQAREAGLTDEEILELTQGLLGADMMQTAEEAPDEVGLEEERFMGGQIDIEPLSDEEQAASTEAYYELFNVLLGSNLPGDKPSEKLKYALRWIAKFEQSGEEDRAYRAKLDDAPAMGRFVRGLKEVEGRKEQLIDIITEVVRDEIY